MKLVISQINPIVGDLEHNFKLMLKEVESAKKAKANLIVFPEMSMLGYPPKDLILKQGLIETQDHYIKELALYSDEEFAIILGGISANRDFGNKFFNSLFCLAKGEIDFVTHKVLLPSYDVFDELRYFAAAPRAKYWEWQDHKIGLTICEDIWMEAYPNLYNRNPVENLIAAGAEIIINASASPYALGKPEFREELIINLVKKYQVPIIYANQVGANDQLIFDGGSFTVDSSASLMARAKSFEPDSLSFELKDLINKNEALELRHSNLEELRLAIILGLKDYCRKCGFEKIVLGLSGGIDSALVAYFAAEALGPTNVYAFMMPSKFTSDESLKDAEAQAQSLGINYQIISIKELHEQMRKLMPDLNQLADENLQSRLRANILMARSNTQDALLLATGNKSEIAVGYSTLYGDSCGGIAVIGDLLKTTVFELARHINSEKEIIKQCIINKEPSAELREDQKDSDSLPEYAVLDQIIKLYVEELKPLDEIVAAGIDKGLAARVLNMVDRAEYKRQQLPPVLKLAPTAFGFGRRMPIAQGFRHACHPEPERRQDLPGSTTRS
ncbi:MAG: NAD+ synthase [Candidatus Melainabacteria bacterium]|nr:NAD+ synthase [Candidatus Melainabacteria bacterium]